MEIRLPRSVSRIEFRCSDQAKAHLLPSFPIHEGTLLSEDILEQAREQAKTHLRHLDVIVGESLPPAPDGSVHVLVWDRAMPPQRIRVQSSDHEGMLLEKTTPRSVGDSGVVKLAIVVGKDGTVIEVRPFPGPEWLTAPAVEAVRRWKYRPTLLNGRPVEVETTVEVKFPTGA